MNDIVRLSRVQSFPPGRARVTNQPDQIGKFYVRNQDGHMVPLDTLVDVGQITGRISFHASTCTGRRDHGCARTRL